MKHYLSILMLALMLVLSCCTKKQESPPTTAADDCPPVDSLTVIGNIQLEHAAELISNFLNRPGLGNVGKTRAIGGTFPLDQFYTFNNPMDSVEGPLLWFCYNEPDYNNHTFFLGVEKRPNLNTYPQKPSVSKLVVPTHTFTYDELQTDKKSVMEYLEKIPQNVGASRLMSSDTVHTYAGAFMSRISRTHCTYPFSFFNNGAIWVDRQRIPSGLKAFLTQTPGRMKYVRYYFGYDPAQYDNKIRVILFGVDSAGYNICQYVYTKDGCKTTAPAIILQKSIPPQ